MQAELRQAEMNLDKPGLKVLLNVRLLKEENIQIHSPIHTFKHHLKKDLVGNVETISHLFRMYSSAISSTHQL